MKRVVLLTALASAPALPCTVLISDEPQLHPDVRQARGLPTNVQLFVAPPVFGLQGTLTGEDGSVVDLAAEASPLGGVELASNTRYVWSRPIGGELTLDVGAGRDDDAPAAPTVRVEAERVPENQNAWEQFTSDRCGYVPAHTAFTITTGDVSAALAAFHTDGTFLAVGRGVVTVRDFDDGLGGVVDLVAVDAAGNTSDVVVVELEQPGGCAQTSSTSTALSSWLLLLLVRRRR